MPPDLYLTSALVAHVMQDVIAHAMVYLQRISPISKSVKFFAKNGMKMKPATATRDTIMVFLYPNLSLTMPLMKSPVRCISLSLRLMF